MADSPQNLVPTPPRHSLNFLGWVAASAFAIFLVVRLFSLIDQYAVNLLYWDNFNYYFTLAGHWNYWQRFTALNGPHREGFGLILSSIVAPLTHWNMRAEAFCIGGVLTFALFSCLWMKRRAFGRLDWYDLIILPALFLSPRQCEIWSNTINSSHGALPLLFTVLFCLSWTVERKHLRDGCVLAVNFLAVFTGFGFFLGIVTPSIFGLTRNWRAFLVSLATMVLFFVNYKFNPAISDFRVIHPHIVALPFTLAAGLAFVCGIAKTPWNLLFGSVVLGLLFFAFITRMRGAAKGDVPSIVTTSLIVFTTLFMLSTVEGRISLGANCLSVSRYIPLLTPGFVGIYLSLSRVHAGILRNIFVFTAIVLAIGMSARVSDADLRMMTKFRDSKEIWIAVYQQTGNLDTAHTASGIILYPSPLPADFEEKMEYLRQHRLNLFTPKQ